MSEFVHREIDKEGWDTLDVIAEADNFIDWMYQAIKPFCSGKVLEIGSGIGNISELFVKDKFDITLTDIRSNYCDLLKRKFATPEKIVQLDLIHADFDSTYKEHLNMYDTVFALNVVEHIEDDDLAIKNCHKLLKANGKCIILVPAYPELYNRFDKELEHYRRYTRKTLNQIIVRGGFEVVHDQYFNFMGIPGWFVSGQLQGNKTIPKGQMSFYNLLVPIFKFIDKCVFNKAGLSVISVGLKK